MTKPTAISGIAAWIPAEINNAIVMVYKDGQWRVKEAPEQRPETDPEEWGEYGP